jgi:hypothetical protein
LSGEFWRLSNDAHEFNWRAGFLEVFQSGVETYLAGDWPSARLALEAALKLKPDDGPALTLLRYMASLQYKRPLDWSGFRELTEK